MPAKVTYKIGRIEIEVSGDTTQTIMQELSPMVEYFNCEDEKCGRCGSTDTRPYHRVAKGKDGEFNLFGYVCNACRSELGYGQTRRGTLYPQRKVVNGRHDAANPYDSQYHGWKEPYVARTASDAPQAPVAAQPSYDQSSTPF